MPIRSTGCATCRKRKIRCDEGRPGCQRCAVHGVPCPGYRTDKVGGIEFKDLTRLTARRATDQYKSKGLLIPPPTLYTSTSSSSSASAEAGDVIFTPSSSSNSTDDAVLEIVPVDEGSTRNQGHLLSNRMTKYTTLHPLPSPGAERAQLYGTFINTYLPKSIRAAQHEHFSFFTVIARKQSEQPALQQSMDALSLVQLGSLHRDRSILKQATLAYGQALSTLASSVYRGDYMHNDDVLAAVTVLATCELYEEIAESGGGWAKHVQGSNQMVAARGPKSLKSDLALLLYSNMRHGALIYALIYRKAPFLATLEWRELAFCTPSGLHDASTYFYDTAIQIPGVLQRHDELDMESANAWNEIDEILQESKKLEADLRNWFADWQATAKLEHRVLFELKPMDCFPTFKSLCPNRAFDHAYLFPEFIVAYLHSQYWMVMHYLRANIQSLQKLRHRLLVNWYPESDEVVQEDELLGYILNICRCIPFFIEPISGSSGNIGAFLPLRASALYFTEKGHWRWLKWVGAVRDCVFVKGLSPPNVQHKRAKAAEMKRPADAEAVP